jgi:hypothetical protein
MLVYAYIDTVISKKKADTKSNIYFSVFVSLVDGGKRNGG